MCQGADSSHLTAVTNATTRALHWCNVTQIHGWQKKISILSHLLRLNQRDTAFTKQPIQTDHSSGKNELSKWEVRKLVAAEHEWDDEVA